MKIIIVIAVAISVFFPYRTINKREPKPTLPLIGTWQLLSGTTIQEKDTQVVDYTKNQMAIKIINGTHFCFLVHDLDKGKNPSPIFSAGGGRFSLEGDKYTEYLEYCNAREWENNKFEFTITIEKDTLVQKGIEKIDSLGVNRLNIEKYIRVKPVKN